MAIYKVSDLCEQINRISNDGHEYIDLELLDGDINLPEKLSFISIKSPSSSIDYGVISSCDT